MGPGVGMDVAGLCRELNHDSSICIPVIILNVNNKQCLNDP